MCEQNFQHYSYPEVAILTHVISTNLKTDSKNLLYKFSAFAMVMHTM